MSGFVVHQPRPGRAGGEEFLRRAAASVANRQKLPELGRFEDGSSAVAFGRRAGSAPRPASSAHGWLVTAGHWFHESLDDAAGLLAALESSGARAFDELDGSFAAAWWDRRDGSLHLALDWLGRRLLYATEGDHGVLIGTSAVALAAAARAGADEEGISEFLACGAITEGRTIFRGVRRLEGGFRYRFADGRLAGKEAAWHPDWSSARSARDAHELADGILRDYDRGVPRAFAHRNAPMVDLTGGLDSRMVVGMLRRKLPPFDVTVTGSTESAEVKSACRLARELELDMRVVPGLVMEEAAADLGRVLEAAALLDGNFDALLYAGTRAVHDRHVADHDATVNGSGGALYRNYWWSARRAHDPDADAGATVLRHLGASIVDVAPLGLPAFAPRRHLQGVVERFMRERSDLPYFAQVDDALLRLRIGCWQGAISSATDLVWPAISPLLWRSTIRHALDARPGLRTGVRLLADLFDRFPEAYRTVPLCTGFPPMRLRPSTAWRFLPGLLRLPAELGPRIARRIRKSPPPAADDGTMADLMRGGGYDYLDPQSMAAGDLLAPDAFRDFREQALAGRVSRAPLGRLMAVEEALRSAAV